MMTMRMSVEARVLPLAGPHEPELVLNQFSAFRRVVCWFSASIWIHSGSLFGFLAAEMRTKRIFCSCVDKLELII